MHTFNACSCFGSVWLQQPVPHTDEAILESEHLQNPATAPQAFSSLLLNIIPDVDSADALDAQMCSEYVQDIYAYLQQLEVKGWDVIEGQITP